MSPRTLERWRWLGEGPQFIKIGGRVRYRIEDIEAFEASNVRQVTGPMRPSFEEAERITAPSESDQQKAVFAEIRSASVGRKTPGAR